MTTAAPSEEGGVGARHCDGGAAAEEEGDVFAEAGVSRDEPQLRRRLRARGGRDLPSLTMAPSLSTIASAACAAPTPPRGSSGPATSRAAGGAARSSQLGGGAAPHGRRARTEIRRQNSATHTCTLWSRCLSCHVPHDVGGVRQSRAQDAQLPPVRRGLGVGGGRVGVGRGSLGRDGADVRTAIDVITGGGARS